MREDVLNKDERKLEKEDNDRDEVNTKENVVENNDESNIVAEGRGRRKKQVPKRFDDYEVELLYANVDDVPKTIEEAMGSKDHEKWKCAMEDELESMYENKVWDLEPRRCSEKVIGTKWVYSVKNKGCHNERYKARLVAQEYNTTNNVPFEEVYAPVVQKTTVRSVLSVTVHLRHGDFKTAYLNGEVEGRVIINQPPGFEEGNNLVCKLNRTIYGLRRSSRSWNKCNNIC